MSYISQHTGPFFVNKGPPEQCSVDNETVHVDRNICGVLGIDPDKLNEIGYGRSHVELSLLKDRLFRYIDTPIECDQDILGEAVSRAYQAFRLKEPIRRIGVRDVQFKADSSAGYGYKGKKGDGDNYQKAIKVAEGLLSGSRVCRTPCKGFSRSHFGTREEPKVRLVWGFPFHQTLIEGMYAQPLQDAYLSSRGHPMVYGHSSLYVATQMSRARDLGYVHMTDFSAFDSSIQPMLIRIAFDILFSNVIDLKPAHREMIERYFICTPIVFSDGERYQKSVGVPSGSFFTQLIDSIVSFIVAHYCCLKVGVNPSLVLVLGDDSLISTPTAVPIKEYIHAAFELGINISDKKSAFNSTEYVHFLGHELTGYGAMMRPFQESIERLIYTERRNNYTFSDSIERCLGHYVDSGDRRALALAFKLYYRAIDRGRSSEVVHRNFQVRGTGYSNALGVSERVYSFSPSLLIIH